MAGWQDAPVVQPKAAWEAAPVVDERSFVDKVKDATVSAAKGFASGTADIGNTVLNGLSEAAKKPGMVMPSVSIPAAVMDIVTGGALTKGNEERQQGLKEFNQENKGPAFTAGRVAGNVAGTVGVGPALGVAAKGAGAAPAVVDALTTGGFSAGGATGVGGLALRAGAGAINGAASTALTTGDAKEATKGAVIGAAVPVAAKGLGEVARTIARAAGRSGAPEQVAANAQKLDAARSAAKEGYVLPPSDVPDSPFLLRALGGLSGKVKTAQVASERNQTVTDALARRAVGLEEGVPLTPEALAAVRQKAAQAYTQVRSAGEVAADDILNQRLNQIAAVSQGAKRSFPGAKDNGVQELVDAVRVPRFDAGDALDMIASLRDKADVAFRQGDNTVGRASKAIANALEDQLERHVAASGSPEAVNAFQQARQLIAKTYTVQKALNQSTGSVSAPVLARELQKGKPLTGELRTVAEAATAFPRATQALREAPGELSPLDYLGATITSPFTLLARPTARTAVLSKPAQSIMLRETAPPGPVFNFFRDEALPAAGRAAPVLLSNQR